MPTAFLAGEPKGKGRPRSTVVRGRPDLPGPRCPWCSGHLAISHYTPADTEEAERRIAHQVGTLMRGRGPIQLAEVRITSVSRRPLRLFRKKDPIGLMLAGVKPDADNVGKLVLDGLQRCRHCGETKRRCRCPGQALPVIQDDQRVARLYVERYYSEIEDRRTQTGKPPRTIIAVDDLEGPGANRRSRTRR